MDKQMIEEMAGCKDCYDNLGHCPSQDNKEICPCYKNAVENYKQGYRKIPENAVVLTREEYASLVTRPSLNTAITVFDVRKETAEKFAEMLKEMAYQSTDWSHGEHPMVVEVDYIDEILEEITDGEKEISNETV